MKRDQRLRSAADFTRVRQLAPRPWSHPLLVLYVAPREPDAGPTRVGITVSGRVGNAVTRNRVRRRLREALRARYVRLKPDHDLVISARPLSKTATWRALSDALDTTLGRARLWQAAS